MERVHYMLLNPFFITVEIVFEGDMYELVSKVLYLYHVSDWNFRSYCFRQ